MTCRTCPNPLNYSPTFCRFNDADLPVTMFETPTRPEVYQMPPSVARQVNERIRRLEAGRAHLATLKTPLHIRAWDWVGNLPHRFGRWIDRTSAGRLLCLSVGGVLAGGMAISVLVGLAK